MKATIATAAWFVFLFLALACRSPTEVDGQFKAGHDLASEGRWEEAMDEYYRGFELVIGPGGPVEVGDLRRAQTNFDEAIELNPSNAKAYSNRGISRLWLGNASGALGDLDRAMELDPTLAVAYIARSETLAERGEPGRAIADLEEALTLSSDPGLVAEIQRLLEFYRGAERCGELWAVEERLLPTNGSPELQEILVFKGTPEQREVCIELFPDTQGYPLP